MVRAVRLTNVVRHSRATRCTWSKMPPSSTWPTPSAGYWSAGRWPGDLESAARSRPMGHRHSRPENGTFWPWPVQRPQWRR